MPLLRRALIVIVCFIAVLLLMQVLLTRDDAVGDYFTLTAAGTDGNGRPVAWEATVSTTGRVTRRGRPTTLADLHDALLTHTGTVTIHTDGKHPDAGWEATIDDGEVTLNGEPAEAGELLARLRETAVPKDMTPTAAVTVIDVINKRDAGELPCPTRSRVSFPDFPFDKAFPGDTYADCFPAALKYEPAGEPIEIAAFGEAPMLAHLDDPQHMKPALRRHFPETLEPVDERLPANPAVVVGPDGVGSYGGTWRRVGNSAATIQSKLGYESFIRFDPAGRIQPALAYRWEVSDNNRVYTFYLRKGHRWSDGHPFTTEDILWVTNTVIGSAYWASSPNWMMETDGRALLYAEDVRDWPALAGAILAEARADAPSMGDRLAAVLGDELTDLLDAVPDDGAPEPLAQTKIVDALNKAFRHPDFFHAEALGGDDRMAELAALRETGLSRLSESELNRAILLMNRNDLFRRASAIEAARARDEEPDDELAAMERAQLNLLLFRLHYRDGVDKARVKKVRIEAVDDGTGDTSHIIRFTFPRPNAIFLAKTGTFMFYRGLFSMPKHHTAAYHPAGTDRLATTDIFDWQGLFDRIRRQAEASGASVGKRVWERLAPEIRQLVTETTALNDLSDDQKQRIVEALNAVFASDDFFAPDAWADVRWDAERQAMVDAGISTFRRNPAKMNLFRELVIRADRVARVADEGLASLSDEERFAFHQSMFRAAYDEYALGEPLVAKNREDGLNHAAQHHPDRYTGWVNLLRRKGTYDPVENPHPPTLRAWRIVTEAIETTQVAVRNPYYYRVDAAGNQLPYIDVIETKIEAEKPNMLLALASGNVDFQVRGLTFDTFTFLKSHEDQGDYEVRLWAQDYCGEMNYYVLQNHKDPVLAEFFQDPRFRHALSSGLNRREIIDVVFGGLGEPAQCCPPEGSPYYNETLATTSVTYDPARANRLLDEMGLAERNAEGIRLLDDGRPLTLNVDIGDFFPFAATELACSHWRDLGIQARMQVRGGKLVNRMITIGILDIGLRREGGNYRAPLQAGYFAPTHPAEGIQWSTWVTYLRTGGRSGAEPPDYMREIDRLWENVVTAPSEDEKMEAWTALAERTAHDLPVWGLMTSPGRVVYVRDGFKNVPELSLAGWIAHEPGNTCPESYFFEHPPE
ncbi:MAG: ABC transporter substrate-binding protein [Planctomycetota bacterium]